MKCRKCDQRDCTFLNSDGSRNPIQCYDSGCITSFILNDRYCPICGNTGLEKIHTDHPLDYQNAPIDAPIAHSFWHCKKCGSRGYDIFEKEIKRPEPLLAPFAYAQEYIEAVLKESKEAPLNCPLCKKSHALYLIHGVCLGFNVEEIFYCAHCKKQIIISHNYKIKEKVVVCLSKKVKHPKYPFSLA